MIDARVRAIFLVRCGAVQVPRGVDLAGHPADRAFVAEAQLGGDLLVGQPLAEQPRDGLFVRFQQGHRVVTVAAAHFLHAAGDVRIDEAAPGHRVANQRDQHGGQQVVRLWTRRRSGSGCPRGGSRGSKRRRPGSSKRRPAYAGTRGGSRQRPRCRSCGPPVARPSGWPGARPAGTLPARPRRCRTPRSRAPRAVALKPSTRAGRSRALSSTTSRVIGASFTGSPARHYAGLWLDRQAPGCAIVRTQEAILRALRHCTDISANATMKPHVAQVANLRH